MRKIIEVPFEVLREVNDLSQLNGDELYARTGLKRNESLFGRSIKFEDGYELTIKLVVGESDECPDWQVFLTDSDGEIIADVSEDYDCKKILGDYTAEDSQTHNSYTVTIEPSRCAIPICTTNAEDSICTAFCDSKWVQKYLEKRTGEDLFEFLSEYTTDEATSLIGDAILEGAVAFLYDEEADEPIDVPSCDGWKYRAFADVISEWLSNKYPEASKAIDAFLNL